MYVLSFCGFLKSAEILELRRSDILFKSDHMELSIVKSKTDQLREGEMLVTAKAEGDQCPVDLLRRIFLRREYQIILRNTFSGRYLLSRSRRSLFPQIGISPTRHTGNPSNRFPKFQFLFPFRLKSLFETFC